MVDIINVILCFSELGDGWGPTVLETEVEHDFIRQSQKGCSADDFFIAGSVYPKHTGSFKHSTPAPEFGKKRKPSYSSIQSGNVVFKGI